MNGGHFLPNIDFCNPSPFVNYGNCEWSVGMVVFVVLFPTQIRKKKKDLKEKIIFK